MSHLISASVLISDLELFERVVATFPELIWNHNKKEFRWYSSNVKKCDHAITYKGGPNSRKHEVGIVPAEDSDVPAWKMEFDPYDQELAKIIGQNGEKLLNEYSEAYARKFAEANGFTVDKHVDAEGNITLELIDVNQ